jgi:hypothetical protein
VPGAVANSDSAQQRRILAAFDQGQIPTIACINKSTDVSAEDFAKHVATLQKALDEHFVLVWGTPAKLVIATDFIKGAWALVYLDNPDVANAYGYHDLTPDGLPLSKVFVKLSLKSGENPLITASHELWEMLVDPAINLCVEAPNGWMYAYESVDSCEALSFMVDGLPISDFVYPAFFEGFRKPNSAQFDHLKKITKPFQILKGGYLAVKKGSRWTQIFASAAKKKAFAREDRRGHRTTQRAQPTTLKRSKPKR